MRYLEEILLNDPKVKDLKKVINLPSKWQTYETVYDHTIEVVKQSKERYPYSNIFLICSYLHDIGKALTREVNKNGFVIFPNHANISKSLSGPIINKLVNKECITDSQGEDCLFIIEHHMRAMRASWAESAILRFIEKMDKRLEILIRFADIDIRGSNPIRIPKDGNRWTKEIALARDAIEKVFKMEV